MDRRKQRFQKRTAVTKEESPAPQQRPTPQAKAQQTRQQFSSLPFVAVITNREAYRGSARNSSRAARPCGAAAPRNGDAHRARLRSEGSLLLSDVPSVHAKMAKYALLTAARAEVPDHAARAESSDSTHHLKHPLFRPVSRCVRSCWRRRVCTRFRVRKRT